MEFLKLPLDSGYRVFKKCYQPDIWYIIMLNFTPLLNQKAEK
jgi:hypothetical protein